jgi:hypothetical protein
MFAKSIFGFLSDANAINSFFLYVQILNYFLAIIYSQTNCPLLTLEFTVYLQDSFMIHLTFFIATFESPHLSTSMIISNLQVH